jgi:hypothetical protein
LQDRLKYKGFLPGKKPLFRGKTDRLFLLLTLLLTLLLQATYADQLRLIIAGVHTKGLALAGSLDQLVYSFRSSLLVSLSHLAVFKITP